MRSLVGFVNTSMPAWRPDKPKPRGPRGLRQGFSPSGRRRPGHRSRFGGTSGQGRRHLTDRERFRRWNAGSVMVLKAMAMVRPLQRFTECKNNPIRPLHFAMGSRLSAGYERGPLPHLHDRS